MRPRATDSSDLKAAATMPLYTSPRWSAGLKSLNQGQTIEFEVVSNRGKTAAENLRVR
jgi:'Cold-shock' DNA-binding domain